MTEQIQYVSQLGSVALAGAVEALSAETVYAGVFAYLKGKWALENLPLHPFMPVKGRGMSVCLRGGRTQKEEHRGRVVFLFDITARSSDAVKFPFAFTKFALESVGRDVTFANGIVADSIEMSEEVELRFDRNPENGEIVGACCLEVTVDLTRSMTSSEGGLVPGLIDAAGQAQALRRFRLQVAVAALCNAFNRRYLDESTGLPAIETRARSEYYDTLTLRLLECACSRISGQVVCQVEFRGGAVNESAVFALLDNLRASLPWGECDETLSGGSKVRIAVVQKSGVTAIRHSERFGMPTLHFRMVLSVVFDPVNSTFAIADVEKLSGAIPPVRQNSRMTVSALEQALALRLSEELNLPVDTLLKRGSHTNAVATPPIPGGRIALRVMDAENHQCNSSYRFELMLYRQSREELLKDLTTLDDSYPALNPNLGETMVGAILKEKAVIAPVAERGKVVHRMRVVFIVKR